MSAKIKTSIGGQALIEGIMMRGPIKIAQWPCAIPAGEIIRGGESDTQGRGPAEDLSAARSSAACSACIDSLTVGYKCLMRSAEISRTGARRGK